MDGKKKFVRRHMSVYACISKVCNFMVNRFYFIFGAYTSFWEVTLALNY